MKKLISILIITFLFHSVYSFSLQDSSRKLSFVLKTDILEPALALLSNANKYSLTIETCFLKRHSFQLSGTYFSQLFEKEIPSLNHKSSMDANSFQLIPEYKFFIFKKKKYSGLFAGVFCSYLKEHEIHESTNVGGNPAYTYLDLKKTYSIIGPIIGYQNYFKKHFAFEFLVGMGYMKMLNFQVLKAINSSFTPIQEHYSTLNSLLRTSIKVGYRF